jgi:hypothetical protein
MCRKTESEEDEDYDIDEDEEEEKVTTKRGKYMENTSQL